MPAQETKLVAPFLIGNIMSEEFKAKIIVGGQSKEIDSDSSLDRQLEYLRKALRLANERALTREKDLLYALHQERNMSELWRKEAKRPFKFHLKQWIKRVLDRLGILENDSFD